MATHKGVKDSGEYFAISPTTRKVTVPNIHKSIGTVGDHNSEQITFVCPQMVDGHDVSQCARRYITWINVHEEVGHDELQVTQVEQGAEGMIYLSWTIRNALTVAKGIVQFSVHFEDVDEDGTTLYRWSTATCRDCDILDSINAVLGAYEAIYVSGETLVIADYAPVKDSTLTLETNGLIPKGTMEITANGTYEIGELSQVKVAVEATAPEVTVQDNGLITAKEGGVESQLQLSAEHDPDFIAENIRRGINIFGVEGTYPLIEDINENINFNYYCYNLYGTPVQLFWMEYNDTTHKLDWNADYLGTNYKSEIGKIAKNSYIFAYVPSYETDLKEIVFTVRQGLEVRHPTDATQSLRNFAVFKVANNATAVELSFGGNG